MEFEELIKASRSIRAFQPRAIEEEKLKKILMAANLAPSAGNLQAYEIYVVKDGKKKRELAKAALDQEFIAEAPVVLVFCANPPRSAFRYGRRGEELYCVQDATIATTFAMLMAADLGLGSVWVGAFYDDWVARILGLPSHLRPIAILPIGYPAERPEFVGRRRLEDLVHYV